MAVLAYLACPKELFEAHKKGLFLLAFTLGYAAYVALGGYLFLVIEGPQEDIQRKNILNIKNNVMLKYPTVPGEAVDEIFDELIKNGVKGIIVGNSTAKWTYGNSILYSVTLLTTIGYGHLSSVTPLGKAVTLLYSALGIPMSLLLYSLYVDRLMSLSEQFKNNLFYRLGPGGYMPTSAIRLVHFTIITTMIAVGHFLFPAWVFFLLEKTWTYLDAFYFCFVSLTTIGLGDLVPGLTENHPYVDLYRILTALYLIFGVTTMMFLMAVTIDFVRNYNKGYHQLLPVVVPPEKVSILKEQQSYGSILIHKTDTIDKNDNIT